MTKYRIVRTLSIANKLLYCVQRRYSWWPFWIQDSYGAFTLEEAKKTIESHKEIGTVVWEDGLSKEENLGKLTNKAFDEILEDDEKTNL